MIIINNVNCFLYKYLTIVESGIPVIVDYYSAAAVILIGSFLDNPGANTVLIIPFKEKIPFSSTGTPIKIPGCITGYENITGI
ncbi:MAG: hypothetical protein GY754_05000 [bacterium]|nr:hypothetical protein [bacterium]